MADPAGIAPIKTTQQFSEKQNAGPFSAITSVPGYEQTMVSVFGTDDQYEQDTVMLPSNGPALVAAADNNLANTLSSSINNLVQKNSASNDTLVNTISSSNNNVLNSIEYSNKNLINAITVMNSVKCPSNALYDPYLNKCITCRDPNFTPVNLSASDASQNNVIENNSLSYMCINEPITSRALDGSPLTFTCDGGETFNPANTNIFTNRKDGTQYSTQFSSPKCSLVYKSESSMKMDNIEQKKAPMIVNNFNDSTIQNKLFTTTKNQNEDPMMLIQNKVSNSDKQELFTGRFSESPGFCKIRKNT